MCKPKLVVFAALRSTMRCCPRDSANRIGKSCQGSFPLTIVISCPNMDKNHMHSNMWDEITYPLPNLNGLTVEVWECINYFLQHFVNDVITGS